VRLGLLGLSARRLVDEVGPFSCAQSRRIDAGCR
jgi:hypothetical protein